MLTTATDRDKVNNLHHILDIASFLSKILIGAVKFSQPAEDLHFLGFAIDLVEILKAQVLYLYRTPRNLKNSPDGIAVECKKSVTTSKSKSKNSKKSSKNQKQDDESIIFNQLSFMPNMFNNSETRFTLLDKMKFDKPPSEEEIRQFIDELKKPENPTDFEVNDILNPFIVEISNLCVFFPKLLENHENKKILGKKFVEWKILVKSPEVEYFRYHRYNLDHSSSGPLLSINCLSCGSSNLFRKLVEKHQEQVHVVEGSFLSNDLIQNNLAQYFDISIFSQVVFGGEKMSHDNNFLPAMKFYDNLLELSLNDGINVNQENFQFYLEIILSHGQNFLEQIPEWCYFSTFTLEEDHGFRPSVNNKDFRKPQLKRTTCLDLLKHQKIDTKTNQIKKALLLAGKQIDQTMHENLTILLTKYQDYLYSSQGNREILDEYMKVSEVQIQSLKRYKVVSAIKKLRNSPPTNSFPNLDLSIKSVEARLAKIREILNVKLAILEQNIQNGTLNSKNILSKIKIVPENIKTINEELLPEPVPKKTKPTEEPNENQSKSKNNKLPDPEIEIQNEQVDSQTMLALEIEETMSINEEIQDEINGNFQERPTLEELPITQTEQESREEIIEISSSQEQRELETPGISAPKRGKKSSGDVTKTKTKTSITLNPIKHVSSLSSKDSSKKRYKRMKKSPRESKNSQNQNHSNTSQSSPQGIKNSVPNGSAIRQGKNYYEPTQTEIDLLNQFEHVLYSEKITSLDLSAYQFTNIIENIQNELQQRMIDNNNKNNVNKTYIFQPLADHLMKYEKIFKNDSNQGLCQKLLCQILESSLVKISKIYSNIKFTNLLKLLGMLSNQFPLEVVNSLENLRNEQKILNFGFEIEGSKMEDNDFSFMGDSQAFDECVIHFYRERKNETDEDLDLEMMKNLMESYQQLKVVNLMNTPQKAPELVSKNDY